MSDSMMDQETFLRRLGTPVKTDSDRMFTHAFLPGLFRAAILKPRYNKRKQNSEDNCHKLKEGRICTKPDVKRLGRSKAYPGSSNISIADLILIANASGEFASDESRTCPAYRYCVERAAATASSVAGTTVDHDDSVMGSEISTLRDLLEPIKQTAMRMKQLSQERSSLALESPDSSKSRHSELSNSFDSGLSEKFVGRLHELEVKEFKVSFLFLFYQCCELEDEESLICEVCGKKKPAAPFSMDEADGKVYVKIISGPGMEAQEMAGNPVMNAIQGIVAQMEGNNSKEMGVQSPGYLTGIPDTQQDDCLHDIPSYEVFETMDIGCGGEPVTNLCPKCQEENDPRSVQDMTLDPMLLKILMMLKNNQDIYLGNLDTNQASIEPNSKSSIDFYTETTKKEDKCTDCVCADPGTSYSEVKSGSKVEVTNEVSFKSSYFVENVETMSVQTGSKDQSSQPVCSLKDVSTSTYKVSIFKQITSMSQSRMTTSRKKTTSSQCNLGSETVRKSSSDTGDARIRGVESGKNGNVPETIEELCPCGCGFFLEGDETCPCGCGQLEDSPCQIVGLSNHNMTNSAIDSKTCENDEMIKGCLSVNELEGTNLEEEARKLQYKIQCYKKENEYFRKLIQEACKGCKDNIEALSHTPPIRATYSGLATAIEILQAKCRSKDGMIAILAEGLRGVVNYAQIAKNLAAPCLEYTYWDFDQSTLYTYLRGTISRSSVERPKDSVKASETEKALQQIAAKDTCTKKPVPAPTDFKVEQQLCKCLFVSWKIPTNIENVAGYRIYIDGNMATNVRSPTRTETILGVVDTSKPTVLVLHSFNKEGELSDPVTLNYQGNNNNNH